MDGYGMSRQSRSRRRGLRHRSGLGRRARLFAFCVVLFALAAEAETFFLQRKGISFQGPSPEDIPTITVQNLSLGGADAGVESAGNVRNAGSALSDETDWSLILVNKYNPLPDRYEVDLIQLQNGESVDARIYPALQEMFDAMRADGVYPVVASGYRTAKKQQSLLDEKIAAFQAEGCSYEEAVSEAQAWVAVPGFSEHQTGLAADINADGIHSSGEEVYGWLDQNACLYGFVRRYPPDKTAITEIGNEPWHYRYVGIKAARDMAAQDLCLEEYLETTE